MSQFLKPSYLKSATPYLNPSSKSKMTEALKPKAFGKTSKKFYSQMSTSYHFSNKSNLAKTKQYGSWPKPLLPFYHLQILRRQLLRSPLPSPNQAKQLKRNPVKRKSQQKQGKKPMLTSPRLRKFLKI